jgi:hypothetical protein
VAPHSATLVCCRCSLMLPAQIPTLRHWGDVAESLSITNTERMTAGRTLQTLYRTFVMPIEDKLVRNLTGKPVPSTPK